MRRAVAALGGNIFAPPDRPTSIDDEIRRVEEVCASLTPLLGDDVQLLVAHGNGPQVGHQLVRVEESRRHACELPLDVCVAQTQGELGYLLARALHGALARLGSARRVAALVTQVEVDAADPAFAHPTKPVGPVLDGARAAELRRAGFAIGESPGRGARRIVPSPEPRGVVESELVRALLEAGAVVVAAGGGGVPIVRSDHGHRGVEAVVDKDLTAALLADELGADLLLLVTDVPCAYSDFGMPDERRIAAMSVAEARALLAEGHFAPGSMGPKIEACARFARLPGRRALVCDAPGIAAALRGDAGTAVVCRQEARCRSVA